jgi:hypothetical protein
VSRLLRFAAKLINRVWRVNGLVTEFPSTVFLQGGCSHSLEYEGADLRYVATEMTTSHTDERSQAYARKWQDMTPFNRYVPRIFVAYGDLS